MYGLVKAMDATKMNVGIILTIILIGILCICAWSIWHWLDKKEKEVLDIGNNDEQH